MLKKNDGCQLAFIFAVICKMQNAHSFYVDGFMWICAYSPGCIGILRNWAIKGSPSSARDQRSWERWLVCALSRARDVLSGSTKCQKEAWVGLFNLKLTQINLEMNCIAMHKCTESKKLDNLKETWDAEVRTWTPHHLLSPTRRARTQKYIFAVFVFVLFYMIQEKRQKIWRLFWKNACLCCCCNATGQGFTLRYIFTRSYTATTNVQNNRFFYRIPWPACTIYNYVHVRKAITQSEQ